MNLNQPIIPGDGDQYTLKTNNTSKNDYANFKANNNIKYYSISSPFKSFGSHQRSVADNALEISNINDPNMYMLLPPNMNPN